MQIITTSNEYDECKIFDVYTLLRGSIWAHISFRFRSVRAVEFEATLNAIHARFDLVNEGGLTRRSRPHDAQRSDRVWYCREHVVRKAAHLRAVRNTVILYYNIDYTYWIKHQIIKSFKILSYRCERISSTRWYWDGRGGTWNRDSRRHRADKYIQYGWPISRVQHGS